MTPYEIFIIHMVWGSGGKTRPVLAFIVDDKSVEVYLITSQFDSKSDVVKSLYFKINDWEQAGLSKQSYVDTGTLITLPLDTFNDKTPIGKLTVSDRQRLLEFFKL